MHTKSKIVLALVAGVALGAAAVQGLHAQAKPKAYLVTESEILDQAALDFVFAGGDQRHACWRRSFLGRSRRD